jgi:hypothetical protein
MRRSVFFAVAILAQLSTADAETLQTFRCDAPHGKRVEYGDVPRFDGSYYQRFSDGPVWNDSDFEGVSPRVAITDTEMLITWGNYVPNALLGTVDRGERLFKVPIQGRDKVSVYGTLFAPLQVHIFRFYLHQLTLYRLTSSVVIASEAPSVAEVYISRCSRV